MSSGFVQGIFRPGSTGAIVNVFDVPSVMSRNADAVPTQRKHLGIELLATVRREDRVRGDKRAVIRERLILIAIDRVTVDSRHLVNQGLVLWRIPRLAEVIRIVKGSLLEVWKKQYAPRMPRFAVRPIDYRWGKAVIG